MRQEVSVSPEGIEHPLPLEEDYAREYARVRVLVAEAKANGQKIVVVMGVGFVGAVMAAIVADSVNEDGRPSKFVIGMQRPSVRSYWKIATLNKGLSPVKAEDPEVEPLIRRCVLEKKTLTATFSHDVLSLADVVIVDVQLDYLKNKLGNVRSGHVEMTSLEEYQARHPGAHRDHCCSRDHRTDCLSLDEEDFQEERDRDRPPAGPQL
jgi:hypothetical protein